jgi:hypothetical protein
MSARLQEMTTMSQAVKLPEPFYSFIRRGAQTLRRSVPAQVEYFSLVGYMVERKGLLNQEQIKDLLKELPFDLIPQENRDARLRATFEKFDDLPGNAKLRQKLRDQGEPVAGMDSNGRLVKTPV